MNRAASDKRACGHDLGRQFLYTLGFNTLIAIFLWSIGFEAAFWTTLVFSHCMGLSILTSVHLALWMTGRRKSNGRVTAAGVVVGSAVGAALGSVVTGEPLAPAGQLGLALKVVSFGLVFGAIVSHFFVTRERVAAAETALREKELARLSQGKELAEARLKLLQAQVEPHFLFNTLANVRTLIDADPPRAREMVDRLSGYLRGCLDRMRAETVSLGDERELVEDYLGIHRIRMGDRLRVTTDLPDELLGARVPPMILQPLVENAIRHGLEPVPEGGEIRLTGRAGGDGRLHIIVEDTGRGFTGGAAGTGLANLRARLAAHYGDRGRLTLEENRPTGVRATVEVPFDG